MMSVWICFRPAGVRWISCKMMDHPVLMSQGNKECSHPFNVEFSEIGPPKQIDQIDHIANKFRVVFNIRELDNQPL